MELKNTVSETKNSLDGFNKKKPQQKTRLVNTDTGK